MSGARAAGARTSAPRSDAGLDVDALRRDFPILERRIHDKRLVFLDSAASAQKPRQVIDAVADLYRDGYANVHRGVYLLSAEATARYEGVRETVQRFINAPDSREIVFTKNVTEAINLVASSFGRSRLEPGDEILITAMEHHANIVPWQLVCEQTGAQLRVAPVSDGGELDLDTLEAQLSERTRIVALTHVSNVLGTVNPVREIAQLAHGRGAVVLVDGAQGVPHTRVDVQELGCDFYGFTAHKLFGPTGVGVLWGRHALLDSMPPYQGGGDMIASVSFEKTTYAELPHKFEAGTPNIAGVVGMGAAIDYVEGIGIERLGAWEQELLAHANEAMAAIPGLRVYGQAANKAAVLSFTLEGVHPHDLGTILDQEGVAIRAGHHCAQPLMERFGVAAMARASFSLYNTHEDVEALVRAVEHARRLFA